MLGVGRPDIEQVNVTELPISTVLFSGGVMTRGITENGRECN